MCVVQEGSSESSVLVCAMFRAFRAVMERNAAAREGFEARVGHHNLAHAVSAITPPTTDVLQQALEMVRVCVCCSLSLSVLQD